jgi:hypothetical protein
MRHESSPPWVRPPKPASAEGARQPRARKARGDASGAAVGVDVEVVADVQEAFAVMTGDFVSQRSDRIDVVRYGLDDELFN